VSDRQTRTLVETPALGVFDVVCFSPGGAPRSEERADVTQVVLPTDGVYAVHRGHDEVIADVASAVILAAGREYRVGHPVDGGDRSIVLVFPPEIIEDALGADPIDGGVVGPRVRLGLHALRSALRPGSDEVPEAEELALLLLDRIGRDLGSPGPSRQPGKHQWARVQEVRAFLAAAPGRRWRFGEVARLVHSSPFHLARQFRAITGESVASYLLRLRVALALERIAQGEADLSAMAADLGFATHSHFSARFRSVLGVSPSWVRDSLVSGRIAELRTIVTAHDRAAS
jgi:AraC family transcriptional regulator